MKTYYITGLTGFLGTNLLLELEKDDRFQIITLVLPFEMDSECLKKPYVPLGERLERRSKRRPT